MFDPGGAQDLGVRGVSVHDRIAVGGGAGQRRFVDVDDDEGDLLVCEHARDLAAYASIAA